MNYFITDDDKLVVDREEVLDSCLQVIGKLSGLANKPKVINFPSLP